MKKKLLPFAAALALLVLPLTALADTFTFTSPITAPNTNGATDNTNETDYNGGNKQFDLDHHNAYVWKLSGLAVPPGHTILSAKLTFKNIANWDTRANILYVHLLNSGSGSTACGNNISSSLCAKVVDNSGDTLNGDYFAGTGLALGPDFGVNNIKLFERSFNMVGQNGYNNAVDFVHDFTPAQLASLASFIANGGNLAFGFDPDCHYWNNGITFEFVTGPASIPEPMSMLLLGSGLAGLYVRRRRQKNSA